MAESSPKRVEKNTVGKLEIAHFDQFLLFPPCFKKHLLQPCENQGLFGKELKNPGLCLLVILVMWDAFGQGIKNPVHGTGETYKKH